MSLSTLLSAILLLLQTERTLATQQSAMNIEPSLLHPHDDVTSITHTTSSAFLRPRLLLPPRGTSAQLFRGKVSRVSDLLRPSPLKMRDVRDVQPKDDDALKVAENSTNMVTAKVAYEVARPTELGTTVDLPSGQAPLDLPQPGEWLQAPLPKPRLPHKIKALTGAKLVDPFGVQDNVYHDSWLDSLCISLFSTRMSAAIEAEAQRTQQSRTAAVGKLIDGDLPLEQRVSASTLADTRETASGSDVELETEEESERLDTSVAVGATILSAPAGPMANLIAFFSIKIGANGASDPSLVGPVGTVRGSGSAVDASTLISGGMKARSGVSGYTYEDYVALATRLQAGAPERQREVVKGVLRSIFPPWFPAFYRTLFPPSKFSAQVNAFMCPPMFAWLVGKSELTDGAVDLKGVGGTGPSQEVWRNTVKVERCRYLEASKCKGTCMNLCKLPTEAFFQEELGMPLRMTPNFEDLSCEFAFGQAAEPADKDPLMQEPCWTECLNSGKQPKKAPQRACHSMPESPLKSSNAAAPSGRAGQEIRTIL